MARTSYGGLSAMIVVCKEIKVEGCVRSMILSIIFIQDVVFKLFAMLGT